MLYMTFTETQILEWAWRIPFGFGGLIGIFGIWTRSQLDSDSGQEEQRQEPFQNPVTMALRTCKWRMLSIVLHCTLCVSQSYILNQWLPSYFTVIEDFKFNAFGFNIIAYLLIAASGL